MVQYGGISNEYSGVENARHILLHLPKFSADKGAKKMDSLILSQLYNLSVSFTWAEFVSDLDCPQAHGQIYVIHDSVGLPIYVGQSINMRKRLLQYIKRGYLDFRSSEVAFYIRENRPASKQWKVTILDLPCYKESFVIRLLNPYFDATVSNHSGGRPTPLPMNEGIPAGLTDGLY